MSAFLADHLDLPLLGWVLLVLPFPLYCALCPRDRDVQAFLAIAGTVLFVAFCEPAVFFLPSLAFLGWAAVRPARTFRKSAA